MMRVCAYACLLCALSAVQMEAININQRVGESVTIKCSDWGVWTNVKKNRKYLCSSPCKEDRHIIIKAGYRKTKLKDRIELYNSGEVLYVTFFNLQKSDAGKYYCGLERTGTDPLIEVNVEVRDAEPSRPSETLKPVIVPVTTSSPVTSPHVSDVFTDMSTTNQTFNTTTPPASAARGAGNVLYLMTAVIVTFTLLMILLLLIRKMRNKQQKVVSGARVPPEDVDSEGIRLGDQRSVTHPETLSMIDSSADPDSIYMNCSNHQDTESAAQAEIYSNTVFLNQTSFTGVDSKGACSTSTDPQLDSMYSVVQKPKQQIKPMTRIQPNQSGSNDDDSFYSLAQPTQAT